MLGSQQLDPFSSARQICMPWSLHIFLVENDCTTCSMSQLVQSAISQGALQGRQQAALHSHPGQIRNHLWSLWHLQVLHQVWFSHENILLLLLPYCITVPLSSAPMLAVTVFLLTGSFNPCCK